MVNDEGAYDIRGKIERFTGGTNGDGNFRHSLISTLNNEGKEKVIGIEENVQKSFDIPKNKDEIEN